MARMYPDRVPESVRREPGRGAECRMYEALLECLPDEWHVFGWVSWIRRRPGEGARDGEADFVIAHPEYGLLVLEVKGGRISRDEGGSWFSRDGREQVHRLRESPFDQANRHRHDLRNKLADTPGCRDLMCTYGHAVAFPDSGKPGGDLGPDAPLKIVITEPDLGRLDQRLEAIGRYWHGDDPSATPLGEDGIRAVRRVLARSFELPAPLGRTIDEDAREIIRLSEGQFAVLDGLDRSRRVLVTGGAGTGKTLLALEKAKRLARDEGFRTLLTCFNRPLAAYLRDSAGSIPGLTVLNFHELCAGLARAAGRDVPDLDRPGLPNEFFREQLPELLVEAMDRKPERFEAIVVDEGQDFSATDRAALELALEDRADSVLYVFQDEVQSVYRDGGPWPEAGLSQFRLTENRRNTRAIHAVLERLVGASHSRSVGPEGVPPELLRAADARQHRDQVSRALHRLIRAQNVPPGAIAVLVSSRRSIPDLALEGRIGAFEVTTDPASDEDRVLVESVTRFKGLERDVVVLARMDPVEYCEYEPMLYVGASRARARLVVVGDDALLARFSDAAPEGGRAST